MYIKKIKIENFRSINKIELELDKINLFWGLNDAGKSNVLKALNLFFNGYTDHNRLYEFEKDFCQFTLSSIKKAKQAPEIKIELILCYYVDGTEFSWKKTWREEGLFIDDLDATHKRASWAKSLVYRYVPAMKDEVYFSKLLTEFYNVFSVSISKQLEEASLQFINVIKNNTQSLSKELKESLKINTQVSLPSDLSNLFSTLDFQTENRNGEKISLNNRGDGIKIRHIPNILKFFAEQQNLVRKKGTTKIHTIWGYEEPENNLELKAAFEKANQLGNFSDDIQMLITTHSPAFYFLGEKEYSKSYKAIGSDSGTTYQLNGNGDIYNSDEGFLSLVAPVLKEKVDEIEKIKKDFTSLLKEQDIFSNNIIFVEGSSDKIIIDYFLKNKYPELDILVINSGGCNQTKNNLISWMYNSSIEKTEHKYYALALFDNDLPGIKSMNELKNDIDSNPRLRSKKNKVKIVALGTPSHLSQVKNVLGENYTIEIEEMFPIEVWKYAREKNWLDETSLCDLTKGKFNDPDVSARDFINRKNFSEEDMLYIMYKIKDNKKESFAKYVIKQNIEIFSELERNLEKFLKLIIDNRD